MSKAKIIKLQAFCSRDLGRQHIFGLLSFLLFFTIAAWCPSLPAASTNVDAVIDNLAGSGLADANVLGALEILRSQWSQILRDLPSSLGEETERSITNRLQVIQDNTSQYFSKEYKSAMAAKRILELSENLAILPYRKIPGDSQLRAAARQQYAAALNRFEQAVPDGVKHLDKVSGTMISEALRQVLTDVQYNVFQPGYGQPLNDQETAELNQIIDGMLQESASLTGASDKMSTQPVGLRDAGRVANNGRKKIIDFLQHREAGIAINPSYVAAFVTWHKGTASIEEAVDHKVAATEQVEISNIVEHVNHQGEQDRVQNDPRNMAAKEESGLLAKRQAAQAALTVSRFVRVTVWFVLAASLIGVAAFILVYRRRGKL